MRPRDPIKAENIRRKALEILVKEGLDGFSMQKLARAAKVSPATLYIHYQDRDDLLFQLYREQMEALGATVLEGFDPGAPFAEGLAVQWRNRIRFYRTHPLEWCFLKQVMHSSLHELYLERAGRPIQEPMGRFVTQAVERGDLTDFGVGAEWRTQYPYEAFWALAFAPLYALLDKGVDPDSPMLAATFQRVLRALKP